MSYIKFTKIPLSFLTILATTKSSAVISRIREYSLVLWVGITSARIAHSCRHTSPNYQFLVMGRSPSFHGEPIELRAFG